MSHSTSRPFLHISLRDLRENVKQFRTAMPRVRPHYAVKSNPEKEILQVLHDEGTCFEVASVAEIDALVELGVDMEKVLYSNPIKCIDSIRYAVDHGMVWFCVDTPEEVLKIANVGHEVKLYLRIAVSNEGSEHPLTDKFGATDTQSIIDMAKQCDTQISGVTFHVGSQCLNVQNWVEGIRSAKEILEQLDEPEMLNIGGGFPIEYTGKEPSIQRIGDAINQELEGIPESIQIVAEPGRYLVGSVGTLVCKVTGIATRGDIRWVYLNAGVFGGFAEYRLNAKKDFVGQIETERTSTLETFVLAGPTCDSVDVMGRVQLPCDIAEGDRLYITNMGAYSTACSSNFNGFLPPYLTYI
jgi:ornithine decarboxylase